MNELHTIPAAPLENSLDNAADAKITPRAEKTDAVFSISSGFVVPVTTRAVQQNARFQPGASGNPKGRPKGSRNRFTETFMRTLADDFTENGASALATLRTTNPEAYIRIIISILPKSLIMKYEQSFDLDFENITMEELTQVLEDMKRRKFIEQTLESVDKP